VADPMVIHWPKGITARGEVRNQYHHSTDVYPTILEACGIDMPAVVNGHEQSPLAGVSMVYSFDAAPDGPTQKRTQYYEMLGTRGIWHDGWKAVTEHGPFTGLGKFESERWQLFHTDVDRSEAHDVADQYPDKARELAALWMQEAIANKVLPLNDLTVQEIFAMEVPNPIPASGQWTYYPGTIEVPERSAADLRGKSYKILAEVEFSADTEGVIVAQGSRFGGYALYVKDGALTYVHNFLGIPPETRVSAPAPRSGLHVVGVAFTKESMGEYHESHGPLELYIDDDVVGTAKIRTQVGHFALCGEGLCIGYDGGDAVGSEYTPRFEFRGGRIVKVVYDVADDGYVDVERTMAAALARD
jgi:arylsulfatase